MCTTIQHMLPWPTRICTMSAYPRRSQYLRMGGPFPPLKLVLRMGDLDSHLIHASLGHPTQHPKWHLNQFSRFCTAHGRVTIVHNGVHLYFQNCPSHGGSGAHLIYGSLGPPTSTTHTASQLVQGSWSWQTDRQTDHAKLVTTGHIYIHSTAMRPNNNNLTHNTQCVGNRKSQVRAVFIHKYTTYNHLPLVFPLTAVFHVNLASRLTSGFLLQQNLCEEPSWVLLQAGCRSCHPTNSVRAQKDTQRADPTTAHHWLASTSLDSLLDSWTKGCWPLHAGSETPVS